MTREEIINEFEKAEINFDYANNQGKGYSADWISDDFSSVLDLIETLVNKTVVLDPVSKRDKLISAAAKLLDEAYESGRSDCGGIAC
jgi:hypothetical protein